MADFLKVFCPIDGLMIAQFPITNQKKNAMGNRSVRDHGVWDVSGSVTCSNGHTWSAVGRIEVRWDPSDTVTT
jgi:hypothetical protein